MARTNNSKTASAPKTSKTRSTAKTGSKTARAKAATALTKVASIIDDGSNREEESADDGEDSDFQIQWLTPPAGETSSNGNTSIYQGSQTSIDERIGGGIIGDTSFNFDRLPKALTANIPDFQSFLNVSDVSSPEAFNAAGYKRVTNVQREQDKLAFGEYTNYMNNIADGISVLIAGTQAAIKAAQLGKAQVTYATARESIETEKANLGIQQSKTRQTVHKLTAEQAKEAHILTVNAIGDDLMAVQVSDLRLTLQEQRAKHANRTQQLSALLGAGNAQSQKTQTA
jgi:hypothetical protein